MATPDTDIAPPAVTRPMAEHSPVPVPEAVPAPLAAPLPALDISIVTYNSGRWLADFFDSLLAQAWPCQDLRVLCLDNGSRDDTHAQLLALQHKIGHRFAGFEVEQGPNVGFGQGHNHNLAKARAPLVLITNVDLTFEADTLTELLGQAQRSEARVAAWECRQKPYEHPKDYHPVSLETSWCSAACLLVRREAFEAVGGFEPLLFMYGEDVELSYRLRDRGWLLQYVPRAVVWHRTYEHAHEVKPLQFLGSTLANVLLRCRYGTRADIVQGFLMYLGLFALPEQFPQQRRRLLGQCLKLLRLAPHFLRTRHQSDQTFGFRLWDYAMVREGAFHPAAEPAPGQATAPLPLVSVLVRTMPGCGGRLREAVASIRGQTYARIELVVVEDGGDTARDFIDAQIRSQRFEHVAYTPLPKSGRCQAGNAALAAARGELLCFLDDDDLFYADHLEVLVAAWQHKPTLGAVYGLAYEIRTQIISQEPWVYRDLVHSLHFRQPFSRPLLWHHNFMPIQTVLFRRDLYERYGGFDEELDNLEDWNLWVRYSLEHDFEMVPKVTSLYRVPADPQKAVARQAVLDDYYAKAQAKHAQLQVTLSPPQVLALAETLSRELYIGVIPAARVRNALLSRPWLQKLYYPAKKFWGLWRRQRR